MVKAHKTLLVLGAGFAGLQLTQRLQKRLPEAWRIVLVDRDEVHVFHADMYEVVAAVSEHINEECLCRLEGTVAIPVRDLVDAKRVEFIQDSVMKVDMDAHKVQLKHAGAVAYDMLVLALGSEAHYFGIPGAEEHAFPLKTIQDTIALNCRLDKLFQDRWKQKDHSDIYISVCGGGATGVEMVAELVSSMKRLCDKYKFSARKVHLSLIQGGQHLAGFNERGTGLVMKRLNALGVTVHLGQRVTKVTEVSVEVENDQAAKEKHPCDLLIWTAGVKVARGATEVKPTLEVKGQKNVFAVGDNAYFQDPKNPGQALPMLGRIAFEQGHLAADNILRRLSKKPLKSYAFDSNLLLVPLGGKYALLRWGPFYFKGFWVWCFRRLVSLVYFLQILPLLRALKTWSRGNRIFVEND